MASNDTPGSNNEKRTVHGTPVVSGVVFAPAVWVTAPTVPDLDVPPLPSEKREQAKLKAASSAAAVAELLWDRADSALGGAQEILSVQASLAMDPAWMEEVHNLIDEGAPAPQAFVRATTLFAEKFRAKGPLMAERITDLEDVRNRVIAEYLGQPVPGIPDVNEPSILLAHDLSPADTAGLDPTLYVGVASKYGGPTSHTSILARQLGIPCIVAVRTLDEVEEGEHVLLDGNTGTIWRGLALDEVEEILAREAAVKSEAASWQPPGRTQDGVKIPLLANVGDSATAKKALTGIAEGIGLLRTEIAYLSAQEEPSVDLQTAEIEQILDTAGGDKVVVRTLDAGSDKPIAFMHLEEEENPALGIRGIRTTGRQPSPLMNQLDAIARAAHRVDGSTVWVMAPMVATISEAAWFMSLTEERGLVGGVMVEVPSLALMADELMEVVDFVSIGTNDLTQYTMAADRLSPHLAEYNDPWQPAVLRLIELVGQAGKKAGKPVGVCGEAAADPVLACVLVGLEVTSLSMAASAIPRVGAKLASVTKEQCRWAARAALAGTSPGQARHAALELLTL